MAEGYSNDLLERHLSEDVPRPTSSGRSAFARDRDRVLYSRAFRALALKTQVVAATEVGYLHNRLTHTLKVAQIGRAIAGRLSQGGALIDPDLVEVACIAHDIGHPPFGHAGESALNDAVERQRRQQLKLNPDEPLTVPLDGFEGNAQNLRVLTRLSTHREFEKPGLHLTRGALAACTKYPWRRELQGQRSRKWGAYEADRETLEWVLEGRPSDRRPVEADLMDWADDVTHGSARR